MLDRLYRTAKKITWRVFFKIKNKMYFIAVFPVIYRKAEWKTVAVF